MSSFPSGTTLTTQHLDNATDSPASARSELKLGIDATQDIIDSYDSPSGIAALDAGGKIANTKLPDTIISGSGNNLTLDPNTSIVKINNILGLEPQSVAQLTAQAGLLEGQVAYCSNGNSGSPCLAVYNGTNWLVVSIGSTPIST